MWGKAQVLKVECKIEGDTEQDEDRKEKRGNIF